MNLKKIKKRVLSFIRSLGAVLIVASDVINAINVIAAAIAEMFKD